MASSLRVTESEILAELRASLGVEERPKGFLSVREMAQELGCDESTVIRRIRKMGSRVESRRVKDKRRDGQPQIITVYRLRKR
jgi:DNA-binding Lrp family transcriptional regulator